MAMRASIAFLASSLVFVGIARGEAPYEAAPRTDENSRIAHQQLLEKKTRGKIDVYFIGDSITRRWGATDERYRPDLFSGMLHEWPSRNPPPGVIAGKNLGERGEQRIYAAGNLDLREVADAFDHLDAGVRDALPDQLEPGFVVLRQGGGCYE